MKLKKHISELKRRNIFKSAIAYLVVAWLIAQVAAIVFPTFDAPAYFMKTLIFILFIGFPINIIIAWIYELTPEGIKKTDSADKEIKNSPRLGKRLNIVIIICNGR